MTDRISPEMRIPKVLVVDDSVTIRKALAELLRGMGAVVSQAQDGRQGMEKALSQHYDLIVSDVEMPHMNGLEMCRELKKSFKTRGIPIIILSTNYSEIDIERGFQAGASAYLPKESARQQLADTIKDVLECSWFQSLRQILVVDDSPTIRNLLTAGLAQAGYKVATAHNGMEALQRIKYKAPDLIISDIDMPGMDGVEFLKSVRADILLAHIPVVIMSANQDRAMMRDMLTRGASAYLVKPFNIEQVLITAKKLLSDQYVLALKEQQRLRGERDLMLAAITSLVQALEARDPYTRGHGEAVATIVTCMAQYMNMSKEDLDAIQLGARLHDIGKIGVCDVVLGKKGRLTEAEYAIIKAHPVIGADILRPLPALATVIPVILHHHEWYDGSGYPKGLAGEDIPLWARMIAVADTFHALTSDRPYRRGMSGAKAQEIILAARGSQLCPLCVDVFLGMSGNGAAAMAGVMGGGQANKQ